MSTSPEVLHDHRLYYSGFLVATLGYGPSFRQQTCSISLTSLYLGMHLLMSLVAVAILSRRQARPSLGRRISLPFSILMVMMSTVTWSLDAWKTERALVEGIASTTPSCHRADEVIAPIGHTLPVLLSDALLVCSLI
jgi:hypothetical protein